MDLSRATPIPPLAATYMLVMGVGFILVGPARFSSPSFRPALALAGPRVWGAVILAAGLVLAVGIIRRHRGLRVAGYMGGAVWCLFFAFTLGWAIVQDERSAVVGAITFVFVGVLLLILARTARRH